MVFSVHNSLAHKPDISLRYLLAESLALVVVEISFVA